MGLAATSHNGMPCPDFSTLELIASGRFNETLLVLRGSDNESRPVRQDDTAGGIRKLAQTMHHQCIVPCLGATTREEFFERVGKTWAEFLNYSDSLHTLVSISGRTSNVPAAPDAGEQLCSVLTERAVQVAGETAEAEVAFAVSTYLRAMRLVHKIRAQEPPVSEREQDASLARRYNTMSSLHVFASYAIIAAASHEATDAAVDCAFDILRAGALEAYGAAREALEIRSPREQSADRITAVSDEDIRESLAAADADLVPL